MQISGSGEPTSPAGWMASWCSWLSSATTKTFWMRWTRGRLDLSNVSDITAFVLIFHENDLFQLLPFFWIPEEKMLEKIRKKNINYDRWNSSQTIIDLQNEGMECNPFGQGYGSMGAPTKEFEKLVLTEKIEHFGNPVLRWMLASTVVKTDPAGNIKPDKEKSVQKIDGIVAGIMALGEWMTAQGDEDAYEMLEEQVERITGARMYSEYHSFRRGFLRWKTKKRSPE